MTIDALPTPPQRNDPANFAVRGDAFLAALPNWTTQANAMAVAMNLNATTDTSTSSVLIGTGAQTFAVSAGKSFQPGMYLVIADTAAPSTNSMFGQVTSYIGTALVMNITVIAGSGTKTAWAISQSAPGGATAGANTNITSLTQAALMASIVADAAGTADAVTATYVPAITALTKGMTVYARTTTTNATTTPTFTPAPGVIAIKSVVKGSNLPLAIGDIPFFAEYQYDLLLDKWILQNPATGTAIPAASTSSQGKVQLATLAEVQAGADALKAVTPATFTGASLGYGQTWQNMTGLGGRALAATIYNTTAKPIQVAINCYGNAGNNLILVIGGITVQTVYIPASSWASVTGIVPPGIGYSVINPNCTIQTWQELR